MVSKIINMYSYNLPVLFLVLAAQMLVQADTQNNSTYVVVYEVIDTTTRETG